MGIRKQSIKKVEYAKGGTPKGSMKRLGVSRDIMTNRYSMYSQNPSQHPRPKVLSVEEIMENFNKRDEE